MKYIKPMSGFDLYDELFKHIGWSGNNIPVITLLPDGTQVSITAINLINGELVLDYCKTSKLGGLNE